MPSDSDPVPSVSGAPKLDTVVTEPPGGPVPPRTTGRLSAMTVWGLALLGAAALLLLDRLQLTGDGTLLWGSAFVAAGVVCVAVTRQGPQHWWAAIPAGALLGLGAAVVVDELPATAGTEWAGAAFLALASTGFWAVYLRDRRRWWALIPAGVLLTLAGVAAVEEQLGDDASGALFFLGLALTFALVAMLPADGPPRRWALIPAFVLGALGVVVVIVAVAGSDVLAWFWPAAFAVGGITLLALSLRRALRERSGR